MLTMVKQDVDLEQLADQIRIAHVKLGAALGLLELRDLEEFVLDELVDRIDEIASDIDRLAAALRPSDL